MAPVKKCNICTPEVRQMLLKVMKCWSEGFKQGEDKKRDEEQSN
jgi:hypothetical protein